MGHLEKLCQLAAPTQLEVAAKFMLQLEREGRDQLERLSRQLDRDRVPNAGLAAEGPPSGERYVEVLKSAGEPVCILHGHFLGVADLPDRIGLTFLGVVQPSSRVERVATENWIDALRDAAAQIRASFGGVYAVELSPI
jgi:hypothetical protein